MVDLRQSWKCMEGEKEQCVEVVTSWNVEEYGEIQR